MTMTVVAESSAAAFQELAAGLWAYLRPQAPRVLSQLDRDPDSPTYGCFDRDFWHYKIRDFSSAVLQQGAVICQVLAGTPLPDNPFHGREVVRDWIRAALRFWRERQRRDGSFDEYYPGEHGFPPTAFSLYAVGWLLGREGAPAPERGTVAAVNRAVRWLLRHPERQAANQEMTALAAIRLCMRLPGARVDESVLAARLDRFFASQSTEGWFPEYGGPDVGYLSVTIDALWDYHEASGDPRALEAMTRAARFLHDFHAPSGRVPGMVNARNTDYLVLYGLTRLAERLPEAAEVVRDSIQALARSGHPYHRTDDRYACHYVFQSAFRALAALAAPGFRPAEGRAPAPPAVRYYADAGILVYRPPRRDATVYVNARKGGMLYVMGPEGPRHCDFGWRLTLPGKRVAVTHWLDSRYRVACRFGEPPEPAAVLEVDGALTRHGYLRAGPARHAALRLLGACFGNRLIPWLKRLLIFGAAPVPLRFTRRLEVREDAVTLRDRFEGDGRLAARVRRAPAHSLRHVASAARFACEELLPPGEGRERRIPL